VIVTWLQVIHMAVAVARGIPSGQTLIEIMLKIYGTFCTAKGNYKQVITSHVSNNRVP